MGGDRCMAAFYIFAVPRIHVMRSQKKGTLPSILYFGKLRSDARGGSSHGEAEDSNRDYKTKPSFLAPPQL